MFQTIKNIFSEYWYEPIEGPEEPDYTDSPPPRIFIPDSPIESIMYTDVIIPILEPRDLYLSKPTPKKKVRKKKRKKKKSKSIQCASIEFIPELSI